MATSFKLPDLGEGLTEGEVARWLVAEGQEIAEDDPLVEIQTDKATVEIPSPYAGTVLQILVAEGEVAPVGAELVVIGEPGETLPTSPRRRRWRATSVPAPTRGVAAERVQATPVVRRIAQELGVDSPRHGHRPGRADHRGRRARRRRQASRRRARVDAGAAARRPPRDRGAHGARASRGAAGDLGRGVRLRGRAARRAPRRRS